MRQERPKMQSIGSKDRPQKGSKSIEWLKAGIPLVWQGGELQKYSSKCYPTCMEEDPQAKTKINFVKLSPGL